MQFVEIHDFHFQGVKTAPDGTVQRLYDLKKVFGGWVVLSCLTREPLAAAGSLEEAKGYCLRGRVWG